MIAKKYWKKPIKEFLRLVEQVDSTQTVKIFGSSFQVHPKVFSPVYSSDTAWFAEKIVPLTEGKRFLEIGSGSGIIACLASMHGSSYVIATDINPYAIDNIHSNAKMHALNVAIRAGSVFDPIAKDELFDIIFWNHPFYYADANMIKRDILAASVYDIRYEALLSFFRKGKNHLTKNGQLMLGTSNIARLNEIKKMARNQGYEMSLLERMEVPVYKGKKTKMDLRVYSFKDPDYSQH